MESLLTPNNRRAVHGAGPEQWRRSADRPLAQRHCINPIRRSIYATNSTSSSTRRDFHSPVGVGDSRRLQRRNGGTVSWKPSAGPQRRGSAVQRDQPNRTAMCQVDGSAHLTKELLEDGNRGAQWDPVAAQCETHAETVAVGLVEWKREAGSAPSPHSQPVGGEAAGTARDTKKWRTERRGRGTVVQGHWGRSAPVRFSFFLTFLEFVFDSSSQRSRSAALESTTRACWFASHVLFTTASQAPSATAAAAAADRRRALLPLTSPP